MRDRRVMIVGLDCLDPGLAFDRFAGSMPNLSALRARGGWGRMRSTTPPITVPAWVTMTSGTSPGALGLYGFRNRRGWSYEMETVTSRSVLVPRLWDLASDRGLRVVVLGVPPTHPPPRVHGDLVSCFLAPEGIHTHPATLGPEIESRFGRWRADVADFRTDDRPRILEEIRAATRQRFAVARHLLGERDWDLFMMVDMGPDRLHHAFWRFFDPTDPRHEPGTEWSDVGRAYYAELDAELGTLLEQADASTTVLVVSDHGARPMAGGIHVNEWLALEGWRSRAAGDWAATRAWAEGGYYARIFLNVRGREPEGTIAKSDVEKVVRDLAAALAEIPDADGRPMRNLVLRPEEAYEVVRGHPPDLLAFFGDLAWRALGTLGSGRVYAAHNDAGPDGANHDWHGVFVLAGRGVAASGALEGVEIADVFSTALAALGVDPPAGIVGRSRM